MTAASAPPDSPEAPPTTNSRYLPLAIGFALAGVSLAGLVVPGSVIEYPRAIATDEPLTEVYPGDLGQLALLATFGLLSALFVAAVYVIGRAGRDAERVVLSVAVVLAVLFVLAYPTGSRDLFKNISDTRTLWVYGDNPLTTAPQAHPKDPLFASITKDDLRRGPAYYGPVYYVLAGPAALIAGDSVLANMVAFKAMHGLALLGLMWLAGLAAAQLGPGRRLQAMVLVGWNPLLLYDGVANAHNDLLMGGFMLLACYLSGRTFIGSMSAWVLSAGVKYVTGLAAPVFLLWHWRNSNRLLVVLTTGAGAVAFAAIMIVRDRPLDTFGIFADFPVLRTPYAVIVLLFIDRLGDDVFDIARAVCLGALALVTIAVVLRSDRSLRSLYSGCFWLLAAVSALGVSYYWPWYVLWYAPLAAALAGRVESRLAVVAGSTGLVAYAIFPYATQDADLNYYMAFLYFGLPVLYLLVDGRADGGVPTAAPPRRAGNGKAFD